jgi:Flp pilus assembly protein TadD
MVFCLLAVVVFITACGPPGPRALLKGKRLLEAGQTGAALPELKTATLLLPTNAAAWNYLGLAYHRAGEWTNAAAAYSRATKLDRDLLEARFNLGCLWLDLDKPDAARTEFIAYTLRRGNAVEGWLKLGSAQLRGNDNVGAEKSFLEALRIDAENVEARNGLGLVQLQRNRPREAAQLFAEALKLEPGYRPALLNLATVSQQKLNNPAEALHRYREYLALKPKAADWDEVSAIVKSLEPPVVASTQPHPRAENVTTKVAAVVAPAKQTKSGTAAVTRSAATPKPEPPVVASKPAPAPQVVTLPPLEADQLAQVLNSSHEPVTKSVPTETETPSATVRVRSQTTVPKTNLETEIKRSGSSSPLNPVQRETSPASASVAAATPPEISSNSTSASASTPLAPGRYRFLSPAPPKAGDRQEAEAAFAQGKQAQRAEQEAAALQLFRRATQLDPAYFEAYYSLGRTAFNLRSFEVALMAWEYALSLRPDNADARYNLALTLKAANYPQDAAEELEKLLLLHPDEARGHLTLGNLYAEKFHDILRARQHYYKVLQMDPRNPQAQAIRYWLVANPG